MPRKLADIPPEIVSMWVDLLALEFEETLDPSYFTDLISCRSVMKGAFFDRATYHVFRDISLVQEGDGSSDELTFVKRALCLADALDNSTELPNICDYVRTLTVFASFMGSGSPNTRNFVYAISLILEKLTRVQEICMSLPPLRSDKPGFDLIRSLAADVAVFFQKCTTLRRIELIGLRSFPLSSLLNGHLLGRLEELSLVRTTSSFDEPLPQSTLYGRPFLPRLTSFTCDESDDAALQLAAVRPPLFAGLTHLAVPLRSGDKPRSWAIMLQAATTLERLDICGIHLEEWFDDDDDEMDGAEACHIEDRKIRDEIKKNSGSNAHPAPLHTIDLGQLVSLRSLKITSFRDVDEDDEHEPMFLSITTLFQNTSVPTQLKDIHLNLSWANIDAGEVCEDEIGWSNLDNILAAGKFPSLDNLSFMLRFSELNDELGLEDVYCVPSGPLDQRDSFDDGRFIEEALEAADEMLEEYEPFLDTLFPKLREKGVAIEFRFRPCIPGWRG